jgi:hypothetical protein
MQTEEKTEALLKTVAYLSRHNLMAVLFLVNNSKNAKEIAQFAVRNESFRDWLGRCEFSEMIKIVDNWSKIF